MTIADLVKIYKEVYYIEDDSMIPLVCAVTLAAHMPGDPIWMMLVGGSSSGKTEIINAITGAKNLEGKEYVYQVSQLTPNTLLSGMKPIRGQEVSLLLQMPRKAVIVFKDFTTILSMRNEDQQAIMGQFREIYDGETSKRVGNMANPLVWKGKINVIGGVTEKIHVVERQFSGMGTRFLHYSLPEQDRLKTARRAAAITATLKQKREHIKNSFTTYLNEKLPTILDKMGTLPEDVSERLIMMCDFASRARSPVERDFKGNMELVMAPEMPMRMSNQLHLLGGVFMAMYDGELTPQCEKILFKIAMDSVPKGRRLVLRVLAGWNTVTTKGCAKEIRYDTNRTRMWLQEINALAMCDLEIGKGPQGDKWVLRPEFVRLMQEFDSVQMKGEYLEDPEEAKTNEYEARVNEDFDRF